MPLRHSASLVRTLLLILPDSTQVPLYRDFKDHPTTMLDILKGRATSDLVDWKAISDEAAGIEFFEWGNEKQGPMHSTAAIKKKCA